MAMSGQMIAQDMQAVQRDSSKQSANGTPWRLNWSLDMTSIFSGHAETHNVQPLQRSRSNSGLPLDTEMLLYHDMRSGYHFQHFMATQKENHKEDGIG
jgi:hypothetical protein